jgi:hypothetical protein
MYRLRKLDTGARLEASLKTSLHVEFEVLTAVVMKSSIFWDIMLCSPLKVRLCLPLAFTLVSCLAYSLTLKMKCLLTFDGLHGIISHEIEFFKSLHLFALRCEFVEGKLTLLQSC